jgi:hypothetical protein
VIGDGAGEGNGMSVGEAAAAGVRPLARLVAVGAGVAPHAETSATDPRTASHWPTRSLTGGYPAPGRLKDLGSAGQVENRGRSLKVAGQDGQAGARPLLE